jgi:hypothetical protein
MRPITKINSDPSRLGEGQILDGPAEDIERPPPLRALLTRPVVVSVANCCVMGLLDIAAKTLMPLVWSTSVEFGGLNMSPASIGCGFPDMGLRMVSFRLSIRRLTTHRRAHRSAARLPHQRPLPFPILHDVPSREPHDTPFRSQPENGSRTSHHSTAHDNTFLCHGIW